jgi:uncharacterized CHY-type Zn-finger protein
MAKLTYKKKPKDTLTFYSCIVCKDSLTVSEVTMGTNNNLATNNITCNKCILGIKITNTLKNDVFILEEKDFNFNNCDYHLIVTANEMFLPVYEIIGQGVTIYLNDDDNGILEASPEGVEVFEYLVRSKIISLKTKK